MLNESNNLAVEQSWFGSFDEYLKLISTIHVHNKPKFDGTLKSVYYYRAKTTEWYNTIC